ncbi:hypothetical protein ACE4RV_08350 [Acetobacter persici]|uniref:hypothetical protein n=1 Tax=Acetobacter persici TaxID=1076596 RepID=UPI0036DDF26B
MSDTNKENKREKIRDNVIQNIIKIDEMSEYFIERYKEDYNKDITDYDFYHLDNCEELHNKYYIELLELNLNNLDEYMRMTDEVNSLNALYGDDDQYINNDEDEDED